MRRYSDLCLALGLLALVACSADVEGSDDFPDFDRGDSDPPVDMGDAQMPPPDCAPGEIFNGVSCLPLPADPCALVDPLLGPGCVDEDGDCFPAKCDDPLPAWLRDCNDLRADQHPGRVELCDGIDNDCDDEIDDGLDLGEACATCGRDGVLECALDGRVACSVEAGQSDAMMLEEACDAVDQDCDGAVDEGCLRPLPPGDLEAPRWCGDRLLYIADGALMALDTRTEEAVTIDAGPVAEPACLGDVDVWLRTAGCDGGDLDAPRICSAAQLMVRVVDVVRPLAPFGDLGAPVIGPDGVYVHERVGDATSLLRAPFDGLAADLIADGVSDPTAPFDDVLIARARRGGALVMEGVGLNVPSRSLSSPAQTPPGRPARDAELIAWIAGAAPVLWVLPDGPASAGAQIGEARMGVPWVRADTVFWLAPDGLRSVNAQTGRSTLHADSTADARRVWVGPPGRVELVDDGARFWAMTAPEPEPEPESAPADGGVRDAGLPDEGLPDADVAADAALDAAAGDAFMEPIPDAGAAVDAGADAAPAP